MYSEKQHFSGVLISHPKLKDLNSVVSNFLGIDFEVKNSDSDGYLHLSYLSKTPFHREPVEGSIYQGHKKPEVRKVDGKNRYVYDCYLSKFAYANRSIFLYAAPFKGILKDTVDPKARTLQSEQLSFHFLDLVKFCELFEGVGAPSEMTISRINLQTIGTSGLKSIAFFGEDVLRTEQYENIKLLTRPSSLRLVYNDRLSKSLSINTDRAGNWSFYLKQREELNALFPIFNFFSEKSLVKSTYNDPRKRQSLQDEALGVE